MLSVDFCHTSGNYAKVNNATVKTHTATNTGGQTGSALINGGCQARYGLGDTTPLYEDSTVEERIADVTRTFSEDEIFETPQVSLSSLDKYTSKSQRSLLDEQRKRLISQNSQECKEDEPECAHLRKNSRNTRDFEQNNIALSGQYYRNKQRTMSQVATYRKRRRSKYYFFNCCIRRRRALESESSIDGTSEISDVQNSVIYADDIDFLHDEPLRKRILRACFTLLYFLLASVAVVVTYSMVSELVTSMRNPVRSIHYRKNDVYEAPGIAVYPGGAKLLACGHYYNNVVTSKVRLGDLDLVNRNCSYSNLTYFDPHYPNISRNSVVVRGPTSFKEREAVFLHFQLEDETRDFYTVSYFVFPGFDKFQNSSKEDQASTIIDYHRYVPTFALSAGLRMWIKLIMSQTYFLDGSVHTDFKVEYSVVKFHDRRTSNLHQKLFFIFFEWKNDITEESHLLYTTTPWSMIAGLCGVFLTLHRGYQLAQTSYKRVQKDKQRRSVRKKKLEEYRKSRRSTSGCDRYGRNDDITL